jgi:hypothetical protein
MATMEEKPYPTQHDEKASSTESVEAFTPREARRIRRRIDLRLIPCLGFMYGISLMDRKNVSNAAVAGTSIHPIPTHPIPFHPSLSFAIIVRYNPVPIDMQLLTYT